MFLACLPPLPNSGAKVLKLREEEEEAHTLTISIYDTKREKSKKEYREAMVSPAPWLPLTLPPIPHLQGTEVDRDSGGGGRPLEVMKLLTPQWSCTLVS